MRLLFCLQLAASLFTDPPCTLQLRLEHVAEWGTTKDFRVSVKTITGQALSLVAQGAAAAAMRRADPREPPLTAVVTAPLLTQAWTTSPI